MIPSELEQGGEGARASTSGGQLGARLGGAGTPAGVKS
jgi:hypothetical protein